MKVEIKNITEKANFVPYKVTFTILTPEESTKFHDSVAIKLNVGAGIYEFIGEIYRRGHNGMFDNHYTTEIG